MDSHDYILEEYKKCIRTIHSLNQQELNRCSLLWNKLILSFKEKEKLNHDVNSTKSKL